MSKKKIYCLFIIAIITAVISIVISCVRIKPVEWDGLAAMAGVLSILVTITVGTNILNVMEIDKKIERAINLKIEESFKEAGNEIYKAIIGANLTQDIESAKYYIIHQEWDRLSSLYNRIIEGYINLDDKGKVGELIGPIQWLYDNHIDYISEHNKKRLISILKKAVYYSESAYELIKRIDK